ncbi:formate/nitrite transporter [Xylanimonas cellulosilytica DSM 15894]|uniref:Formate/nitrite transporter n=1 Tax=Xylanimonas cellulosilytica (strain DSM 15894 / JCM 12276 / CECT 5975 / KCTC 9989 / LMG 20990 / NBRC 107835 / XIL07) TaxID=446471 RepID=D1BZW8_XYLCX|nr:formate/nitrite transporter family protein [Xylanimonas cellulosilytica]ACZ32096.1 formate/nitrite transporter [Xylanimonas cellulosilytica DSM 15894]
MLTLQTVDSKPAPEAHPDRLPVVVPDRVPTDVVDRMVESGAYKAARSSAKVFVQALLASFVFGAVVMLTGTVIIQTGIPFLGALVFPMALVIVILLGLELVTSSMGLVPLAWWRKRATGRDTLRTIGVAIAGHIIGCALFALVFWATVTEMGHDYDAPLAVWIRDLAMHKTHGYQALGAGAGLGLVFLRAVLCNWLVSLGAVMGMTTRSTGARIAAIWMPITLFFALQWEHSVVNLFVIPAGMLAGAPITFGDWWLWNEIPVLLGNIVGAALLTAMGLWVSQRGTLPWSRDPFDAC